VAVVHQTFMDLLAQRNALVFLVELQVVTKVQLEMVLAHANLDSLVRIVKIAQLVSMELIVLNAHAIVLDPLVVSMVKLEMVLANVKLVSMELNVKIVYLVSMEMLVLIVIVT